MAPKKPSPTFVANSKVAGPHTKVEKAWTFKKYQNGLLNLKAPARYMKITKSNSTTSPLLNLPPEIRNNIFRYAMGGYNVFIAASNHTWKDTTITLNDGKKKFHRIYEKNRILTTILPKDAVFRSAKASDDLPNLSVPRVCRQLYTETALLPYMLNHFKFVGNLSKTSGGKYAKRGSYSTFDFWLELRVPAQLQALTSIAPTMSYTLNYLAGDRPAFRKRFPGLKYLDLQSSSSLSLARSQGAWEWAATTKDREGDIVVTFSATNNDAWNQDRPLENAMKLGRNHIDVIVDVEDN